MLAIVVTLAACSHTPPARGPEPQAPKAAGADEPIGGAGSGEDITSMVRRWSEGAAPPTSFRPGHVTPRTLDAQAIERTGSGFRVTFPSHAPITTPAVHDGRVLVSGGFHGKEVYAFDARSGALAWALNLDDDGPSAPACEDRVCVFNTESCTIFAVDIRNGELLWSAWLGDPLMSAPAIAGGIVYAAYPASGGSGPAQISNAQQMNQLPLQQANQAPVAQSNQVQPNAGAQGAAPAEATHALAAFDLHTGKVKWARWIDGDVISSPVVSGGSVVAASQGGTVFVFDAQTGEVRSARRSRATSAPIVVGRDLFYTRRSDKDGKAAESITREGSRTYVTAGKRALYIDSTVQSASKLAGQAQSLDAQNGFGAGAPASANAGKAFANIGQLSVSSLQTFQGSRLLRVGSAQVNVMGDEVVCTNAEDGKEQWRHKLTGDLSASGGSLGAPPAAAGGSLFVATLGGEVLRFDAKSGAVQARHALGAPVRSQPVVEGGMLYVGTDDGKLVAIDLGDARFTGWPQWGGNAARTGVPR
ncbi:serine/threonine protein kinase related protein [Minicystis rosea]|nr:serine/threonine protein kinase related protein [Minicystis rosea]